MQFTLSNVLCWCGIWHSALFYRHVTQGFASGVNWTYPIDAGYSIAVLLFGDHGQMLRLGISWSFLSGLFILWLCVIVMGNAEVYSGGFKMFLDTISHPKLKPNPLFFLFCPGCRNKNVIVLTFKHEGCWKCFCFLGKWCLPYIASLTDLNGICCGPDHQYKVVGFIIPGCVICQ